MITGHVASWGQRPPTGTASINWNHPLASSLVQLIVNGTDLVTDQSITSFSAGAKTDTNGQGVILAASSDYAILPRIASSPLNRISTATTVSVLVDAHAIPASGGAFWSVPYNATWANPYATFFGTSIPASVYSLRFNVCYSSSAYVEWNLAHTMVAGRWRYTVTRDGTAVKFYRDNVYLGAGTVATGTDTNAVDWPATVRNVVIGNAITEDIGGGFPNAHFQSVGVWSRALTAGEITRLTVDPYCMVMPR